MNCRQFSLSHFSPSVISLPPWVIFIVSSASSHDVKCAVAEKLHSLKNLLFSLASEYEISPSSYYVIIHMDIGPDPFWSISVFIVKLCSNRVISRPFDFNHTIVHPPSVSSVNYRRFPLAFWFAFLPRLPTSKRRAFMPSLV